MIKRKQYKISNLNSKLAIYHLQDLSEPIFKFDKEEFLALQCGFVIKSKGRKQEPTIFIFKGFNIDYKVECERRPGGRSSTKLTEAKTGDSDEFRRCRQHVIDPLYLQITLERTNETFG